MITKNIKMDIEKGIISQNDLTLYLGDYDSCTLQFTFYNKGKMFDVSQYKARLSIKTPSNMAIQEDLILLDNYSGYLVLSHNKTSELGKHECQVQFYDETNVKKLSLQKFNYVVSDVVISEDDVIKENSFSIIQDTLERVELAEEKAQEIIDRIGEFEGLDSKVDTIETNIALIQEKDLQQDKEISNKLSTLIYEEDKIKTQNDIDMLKQEIAEAESNINNKVKINNISTDINFVENNGVIESVNGLKISGIGTEKELESRVEILESKVDVESVSSAIAKAIENIDSGSKLEVTENNIVEDVSLGSFEPTRFTFDNFLDVSCELLIKSSISSYENVILFIEGQFIRILDSVILFYGFGSFEVFNYNISQYRGQKIRLRATLGADKVKRIYINNKLIAERYNANNKLGVTTNSLTLINNDLLETSNLFFANRQLTPQEIEHNFSILNTTPSINKINGYVISTDTSHVQDRLGRTQEDINKTFYKSFCQEIISNGEDITVENGLNGYLLGAKMEGQTLKNEILSLKSKDPLIDYSNEVYTLQANGQYLQYITFDVNTKPNTQYTIILNVLENTMVCDGAFSFYISDTDGFPTSTDVTTFKSSLVGKKGIIKGLITSKNTSGTLLRWGLHSKVTSGTLKIKDITIVEGDFTNKEINPISIGMYSAKAIITNNGEKYCFYASEEDKAQDKVIELPFAEDTITINEDGSGTWVNVSEKVNLVTLFTPNGFVKTTTVGTNTTRWYFSKWFRGSIISGLADFNGWSNSVNSTDEPCVGTLTNSTLQVRVPNEITTSQEVYDYLKNNNMLGNCILKFSKANIETHIPKELMPTIATYETNNFIFGEEVKPSKASVTLPASSTESKLTNIVAQQGLNIAALDKKVTSNTSNIESLKTTTISYGIRLASLESATSEIATLKDNVTTLENEIALGLDKILEALV